MENRLKQIRKDQNLNQTEFGSRLNLTKNYIYLLEAGANPITDKVIASICKEFGVNETWLRSGEGEMYAPATREQRIAQIVSKLFNEETNPHMINIINVVTQMSDEQIELLIDVAKKLAKEEEEQE